MRLVCVDIAGTVSNCEGPSPGTILKGLDVEAAGSQLSCKAEGFIRHLANSQATSLTQTRNIISHDSLHTGTDTLLNARLTEG
jgi:hypothetical protein